MFAASIKYLHHMKKKNIISLTIAFAFLSIAITGLLLYFAIKPGPVTAIHVAFGLLFIGFAIFHIKNNWASIKVYSTQQKGGSGIKKELLIAVVVSLILLAGVGFGIPPFNEIQHAGEELTKGERREGGADRAMFVKIATNENIQGTHLNLIIEKNDTVLTPVIVIWVEDTAGNFMQNLFVPAFTIELPEGETNVREAIEEGEATNVNLDPALLPQWAAKTSDKTANFKNATPTDNFFLSTNTSLTAVYNIFLQVRSGNIQETYFATIDASKSKAFVLQAPKKTLLNNAILTLK